MIGVIPIFASVPCKVYRLLIYFVCIGKVEFFTNNRE